MPLFLMIKFKLFIIVSTYIDNSNYGRFLYYVKLLLRIIQILLYNTGMSTYAYTNKDFSDALKELLEEKKWSYNQLSYRCELSSQYLNQIVNKKSLPPKDENIIKIARAFNLEPGYFKEYRNRRLSEKMLEVGEDNNRERKQNDIMLSPEEIRKLEIIISEVKERFGG